MIGVAIVSIIVGEGGKAWLGALVLGSQLRQLAPSVPRLLWLDNVSAPVQILLRPLWSLERPPRWSGAPGWHRSPNGRCDNPHRFGLPRPRFGLPRPRAKVWSAAHEQSFLMKLQLWGLTRYRALLFLDVDVVLHASPVSSPKGCPPWAVVHGRRRSGWGRGQGSQPERGCVARPAEQRHPAPPPRGSARRTSLPTVYRSGSRGAGVRLTGLLTLTQALALT